LGEFSPIRHLFTLGSSSENDKSSPNFGICTFQEGKIDVLVLTKNGMGYILGDFFTNSSGHPAGGRYAGTVRERYGKYASQVVQR
jgi:hypothetical protein